MENYLIVLFRNKIRYKILKKYITYKRAKIFFDNLIKKNEEVIFEKRFINGEPVVFEIGLVERSSSQLLPVYVTDELGRNIRVRMEDNSLTLANISLFKEEEEIFDLQSKSKITVPRLIKKYFKGTEIKMVSSLNNKVIVQNNLNFSIFSLKNEEESKRLIDSMTSHFLKIKRGDCIFVKDNSVAQKKYLYKILCENGFDKKMLYRKFTTYPQSQSK
jgi:hypothetical protein